MKIWFSEIMGISHEGVQDIRSFWDDTIRATSPQLNSEFFLHKRASVTERIQSIYNFDSPKQIVLVGDSWIEAILCIAAEMSVSDDISVISMRERCVIANTYDALNEFDTHNENAIIIPTFHFSESFISVRNNTLLLVVDRYNPLEKISRHGHRVEIPPRTRHEFCEAIEKLGFDINKAFDMGQKLHCSFPALLRQIHTDPLKKIPEWSRHENSVNLIPALFAGSWEQRKTGDKEIISALAGISYDEYIASINNFTKGETAPIFSVDYSYACISIGEMWDCLWAKIYPNAFDAYKECFLKVFGESDPAYELPEEEWCYAEILGKSPSYSTQLKKGMIVSLIMMSERKSDVSGADFSENILGECVSLVKQVFDSIDSVNKWRSICPFIPLFIEAAPNIVLKTLEHEVTNPNTPIWSLFHTSLDSLLGREFYTHILWALENVLWDETYAVRALKLLISFSEKRFDYKLANKPEDTLYRVFCIWHPQGVFSFEERKILLSDIVENHGTIAPGLFNRLLSAREQLTTDISKPKWKLIEAKQEPVTPTEVIEMREYLSSLYLDNISPCYEEWNVVFSNLLLFGQLDVIVEKCTEQASDMEEEDVLKLCRDLAHYIGYNKKYGYDNKETIDAVEGLYNTILPDTPKYFAHYFAYHFDGLNPTPYTEEEFSPARKMVELSDFQKGKMKELVENYGCGAVIEIIPLIENTFAYATSIVDVVLRGKPDWKYIFEIREMNPQVAASIIVDIYNKGGINCIILEEDVTPQESDLGWVLSCLPICEEITQIVDKTSCEACKRVYWENVRFFAIADEVKKESWLKYCVSSLIAYNRPYSVVDYLAYSEWNDPKIILDVLYATLIQHPKPEPSGLQLSQVGSRCIENLFKKIYSNSVVSESDVAKIELAYIKAFGVDFEPQCLMRQLLHSPDLYFELLVSAYLSDNESRKELSGQEKAYMKVSLDALNRIRRIPGSTSGNTFINEKEFQTWIDETGNLARENYYLNAHNSVLGKILSYSPVGQDGLWPAECVRTVFEKPHAESLETSFILGLYNQRGVHAVTAGVEEEKLANDYMRKAQALQLQFPQTAAILLRISEMYYSEAKTERARELKGGF